MNTEEFTLSEGTPLHELHSKRVKQDQDLVVITSDYHNRRGTGKSIFSLKLAEALDQTEEGLTVDKCSLSAEELIEAYVEQPEGSALVLDEAEAGLSKYEAGSSVNRAMRKVVSMGRVEQKYLILNMPASAELDRDLKALCDVWCLVLRKGQALVHFLKYNPYKEQPLPTKKQTIEWSDIHGHHPIRQIYKQLTREKKRRLRGEDGDNFIQEEEALEMVERAEKETEKQTRNVLIKEFYDVDGLTHQKIADAVGLSRTRVTEILNEA